MKQPQAVVLLSGGLDSSTIVALSPTPGAPPPPTLLVIDVQNFYFPGGKLPLAGPEAAAPRSPSSSRTSGASPRCARG